MLYVVRLLFCNALRHYVLARKKFIELDGHFIKRFLLVGITLIVPSHTINNKILYEINNYILHIILNLLFNLSLTLLPNYLKICTSIQPAFSNILKP